MSNFLFEGSPVYADEMCSHCNHEFEVTVQEEDGKVIPTATCPECKKEVVLCSICNILDSENCEKICAGCTSGSKFELHEFLKGE